MKNDISMDDYINNYKKIDSWLINYFLDFYLKKNNSSNKKEIIFDEEFLKLFFNFDQKLNISENSTLVVWDFQLMTWIIEYTKIIKKNKIKNILYFDDKDHISINPIFKRIWPEEYSPWEKLIYLLKEKLKKEKINLDDINFYKSPLKASNTKDNSFAIIDWIEKFDLNKNIIYPTKKFHTLRSLLSLKKFSSELNINIIPIDIFLYINWKYRNIDYDFYNEILSNSWDKEFNKIRTFLENEMKRIFSYTKKWDLFNYKEL